MDVEKLILEIRKREALYNVTSSGYCNPDTKGRLWSEVSSIVHEPVEDCKKKWKCVRDAFAKEVKLHETNTKKKRRRYIFYEDLKFLLPYLRKNLVDGSSENSQDTDVKIEEDASISITEGWQSGSASNMATDADDAGDPQESTVASPSPVPLGAAFPQRKSRKHGFEERLLEKQSSPAVTAAVDEDELFLRSILLGLKELGPRAKELLKIRMAHLVYEARFGFGPHACPCVSAAMAPACQHATEPSTSRRRDPFSP